MGFVYLILYSIWWVPGHTSLGCHISQGVFGQDDQIISLLWCHINIFQHCLSWVSSCCNSAWNLVTLLLTSFFVGSKITQNTRNQRPNWTDLFTKRSKKRRMNLSGALWFAWVILSARSDSPCAECDAPETDPDLTEFLQVRSNQTKEARCRNFVGKKAGRKTLNFQLRKQWHFVRIQVVSCWEREHFLREIYQHLPVRVLFVS